LFFWPRARTFETLTRNPRGCVTDGIRSVVLDLDERDSPSSSTAGQERGAKTMKTSEETADFEKEFRPDDVGK